MVFLIHLLKPTTSSNKWTGLHEDAGLLQDRKFESVAEDTVKKSTKKTPVPSEISGSKKSSILIILCRFTAGTSSLTL
jgi:hypothetical protein